MRDRSITAVWGAYPVTQLLKRTVCNGPAGFVQTHFPVVNIQDSRPCYCGEVYKESTCITHARHRLNTHLNWNPLSFCLKAISSNIWSSVASASGSLVLQVKTAKHANGRLKSGFITRHLKKKKKWRTKIVFFTGSRVSQQRVGSFCDNLFQNLAGVFGNTPAWKTKEIRTFTEQVGELQPTLISHLQHADEGNKVDSLQPVLVQVWEEATNGHNFTSGSRCLCHLHLYLYKQDTLHTFRWAIRGGDNNNSVLKQILKELLENHGVSDVGDLKRES